MTEHSTPLLTAWPFTCADCGQRFDEGSMSYGSGVRGQRMCVNCYKYAVSESGKAACPDCFIKHQGECW